MSDYAHDTEIRSWPSRAIALLVDWGIFAALIVLFAYFALSTKYFFTTGNMISIGTAVAVTGILAAVLTVALICGLLDLTIGVGASLSTTIVGTIWISNGHSLTLAIVAALAAGLLVGLVNGVLVVDVGINSIIATIAMSQFLLGVALVIPKERGQNIYFNDRTISDFVNGRYLGVPLAVYFAGAVFLILWVMLTHTKLGWHIYATGGNPSAALRAGIPTGLLYRFVFMLTALASVVAGIILVGRGGIGGPTIGGEVYTFDALTAVLLGGIGLSGGTGRIQQTLAGVLLVGVLENGLTLRNVDGYYQVLVRGTVLVLAVVIGAYGHKRRSR